MSLTAITSLRRKLGEWAERPANRRYLRDDQEAQLRAGLGDPRRRAQVNVSAWMLGTWHLGNGFLRVLGGDGGGFDEARIGHALRRGSLLLRARQNAQPGRRGSAAGLPFSLAHGAISTLLGIALDDPRGGPLYDLLHDLPDHAFGESDHLALFARELLRLRNSGRAVATQRLGPYEGIVAQWTGETRLLGQQLALVLDLHLEQAHDRGVFDDPGMQLYPAEVLAVLATRAWLDLPCPKVEHPLMHTNLVTMTPGRAWPEHDLTSALDRELRRP